MSSQTTKPPQSLEEACIEITLLQKRLSKSETERDQLERAEATFDVKLRDKDNTILALQTALDNSDRPQATGEAMDGEQLQARTKSLEAELKRAKKAISETAQGNWMEAKSYLDERLMINMSLAKKNERVAKEESKELREFMTSLAHEYERLLLVVEDDQRLREPGQERLGAAAEELQAVTEMIRAADQSLATASSALDYQRSELDSITNKIRDCAAKGRKQFVEFLTGLSPITQGVVKSQAPDSTSSTPSVRGRVSDSPQAPDSRPSVHSVRRRGRGSDAPQARGSTSSTQEDQRNRAPSQLATPSPSQQSRAGGACNKRLERELDTPLPAKPRKASKSPGKIEILRLKTRQSLHRLKS